MVYQTEKAPETGKLHVQGYMEINKSLRMGAIKKWDQMGTAHLEKRHGTPEEAIAYCTKEESRLEEGVRFEFGKSTSKGRKKEGKPTLERMNEVTELIKAGSGLKELIEMPQYADIVYRNTLAIKEIIRVYDTPKSRPNMRVVLCYGKSGMGKTHCACHDAEGNELDGIYRYIYPMFYTTLTKTNVFSPPPLQVEDHPSGILVTIQGGEDDANRRNVWKDDVLHLLQRGLRRVQTLDEREGRREIVQSRQHKDNEQLLGGPVVGEGYPRRDCLQTHTRSTLPPRV